jgi:hypothetical protein
MDLKQEYQRKHSFSQTNGKSKVFENNQSLPTRKRSLNVARWRCNLNWRKRNQPFRWAESKD